MDVATRPHRSLSAGGPNFQQCVGLLERVAALEGRLAHVCQELATSSGDLSALKRENQELRLADAAAAAPTATANGCGVAGNVGGGGVPAGVPMVGGGGAVAAGQQLDSSAAAEEPIQAAMAATAAAAAAAEQQNAASRGRGCLQQRNRGGDAHHEGQDGADEEDGGDDEDKGEGDAGVEDGLQEQQRRQKEAAEQLQRALEAANFRVATLEGEVQRLREAASVSRHLRRTVAQLNEEVNDYRKQLAARDQQVQRPAKGRSRQAAQQHKLAGGPKQQQQQQRKRRSQTAAIDANKRRVLFVDSVGPPHEICAGRQPVAGGASNNLGGGGGSSGSKLARPTLQLQQQAAASQPKADTLRGTMQRADHVRRMSINIGGRVRDIMLHTGMRAAALEQGDAAELEPAAATGEAALAADRCRGGSDGGGRGRKWTSSVETASGNEAGAGGSSGGGSSGRGEGSSAAQPRTPGERLAEEAGDSMAHTDEGAATQEEGSGEEEQEEEQQQVRHEGCARPPLNSCSEWAWYQDWADFMSKATGKEIDPDNVPIGCVNRQPPDLFALYREVCKSGGFKQDCGINWKGKVFPAMHNYTPNHKCTSIGSHLRRLYCTWLLQYEDAHPDDVMGDECALCQRGTEGGKEWLQCEQCEAWVHLRCDPRPGLGRFSEYEYRGRTYKCAPCTTSAGRAVARTL